MKPSTEPAVTITASTHRDKKTKNTFSDFMPPVIKAALLSCGCSGSVFTFLSCLSITTGVGSIMTLIILSSVLFVFIFGMKAKYEAVFGGAAAAAFVIWTAVYRYEICAGAAAIVNPLAERVNHIYRSEQLINIAEPELADRHKFIFLSFAVIFLCAVGAYLMKQMGAASAAFISLPVLPVLLVGLEPNTAAFIALITFAAAMISMDTVVSAKDDRIGKCAAYCALTAAAAAALCLTAVDRASDALGYERPEAAEEIYLKAVDYFRGGGVKKTITEIVEKTVGKPAVTGAIDHGKLGEFDEISFDGRTVLEVTIPKSDETVYLRGYVGSVYTGSSWETLSDPELEKLDEIIGGFSNTGLSPMLMDGSNLWYTVPKIPECSFTIKNIDAGKECLYMPYNLVPPSVSRYEATDSGFTGGQEVYMGQFYNPRGYYGYQNIMRKRWSSPGEITADEAIYRQFVYENYLEIPESFVPEKIFNENYYQYITAEDILTGKSSLDEMTVFSRKIYFIRKWLRDNCEYSLEAPKLHLGEDFVNSFLERRTGSCSHFASAAVIMCRYAGIPARYVEGYVIKPADFPSEAETGKSVTVDVTDARGHAWAEVYIDGFGWYPMEFTSGYGNVRTAMPTETTVTETETETESSVTEETTVVSQADGDNLPAQENTDTATETTIPGQSDTEISAAESSVSETIPSEESLTENSVTDKSAADEEPPRHAVGFKALGITGSVKAEKVYDLTWLVILAAVVCAVLTFFYLRRRALLASRRRVARLSAEAGVMDDYRRFKKLMKLMDMPEQGEMSFAEYSRTLSERSEMLSDGTAELVIQTALKASFGGGSLTRNEADETRLAVNSLAKRFRGTLSKFGKIKLKFWHCLI